MRGRVLKLLGGLAAISCTANSVAAQESAVRLQPSGPWVVDWSDNHCALRRDFGTEEERMLLELRQYTQGNSFHLLVGSETFRTVDDEPSLAFLPGDVVPLRQARFLEAPGGIEGFTGSAILRPSPRHGSSEEVVETTIMVREDDPARAYSPNPTEWTAEERSERERTITAIHFETGFNRQVELATGPLNGAMDALRTCVNDLLIARGIDPAAPTSELSRPATPIGQARWARRLAQHYPGVALMRGQQATLQILLQIDTEGRVSGCDVRTDIDPEIFRRTACQRLERYARFEPALDHEGNPTVGSWSTRIIYAIN